MTVRMISKTMPCIDGITNLEEYIGYVARVSNPDNQMNTETTPKLLSYLIRNHHFSPFEMASITLEIVTTRDIGRQILRHRSFSFQEFSQRYAAVNTDNFVIRDARLQDLKNRQNSIVTNDPELQIWWTAVQKGVFDYAGELYQESLDKGIAKEQARALLPEGLTPTTIYMAGTVRSWIHYIHERSKPGVQLEHRNIAVDCSKVISKELPSIGILTA